MTQAIEIDSKLSYEQCLGELEQRIEALEGDKLDVAGIITAVREGRAYHTRCVEILNQARREIEVRPDDETPGDLPPPGEPPDVDPDDIPF